MTWNRKTSKNVILAIIAELLLALLLIFCCSKKADGQPITKVPLMGEYQPKPPCPECITIVIPKLSYGFNKHVIPTPTALSVIHDTVFVPYDREVYLNKVDTLYLADNTTIQSITNIKNEIRHIHNAIGYRNYRQNGLNKLGAGLLCQAVGVGLILYGNTPIYQPKVIKTSIVLSYSYKTYDLKYNPPPVWCPGMKPNWCPGMKPNWCPDMEPPAYKPKPLYELVSHDAVGTVSFEDIDRTYVEKHRSTAYYWVGGSLALVGLGLEVWGVIDLNRASVCVGPGYVALTINFGGSSFKGFKGGSFGGGGAGGSW